MEHKENDITNIVSTELVGRSFDQLKDVAEFGLDQFINNGILKDIPFVNMVIGFYNIKNSIIDRHKAKKIITFFQEFNSGEIDDEKFNQFSHRFSTDEDYRQKVVETILLLNERFLQIEKSKILANLVLAHINGKLSWTEFSDITYTLDGVHPRAFFLLKELAKEKYWKSQMVDNPGEEGFLIASGLAHRQGSAFIIVEMGQKLYEYGLKPSGV